MVQAPSYIRKQREWEVSSSDDGLLTLGHDLVDGEVVGLVVVGAESGGVSHALLGVVVVATLVLEEMLNVGLAEVALETLLHVFDFFGEDGVVVVSGGVVDESFVEDGLEEEIEITHNTGVVAVLILLEDGDQAIVDLSGLLVLFGLLGEAEEEFAHGEEGEAPPGGHNSGTRVGLAHALEEADVEAVHTGGAHLLHVLVEPQVVGAVASQVELVTIQVHVPHFIDYIIYYLLSPICIHFS